MGDKIIIEISTVNAAFQNGNKSFEIARILKKMIFDLENYDSLRDSYNDLNGNKVVKVTTK
jgi:hypothetical protein